MENQKVKAKEYQVIKKRLSLFNLLLTPLLLAIWVFSGLAVSLQELVLTWVQADWLVVALFFTLFSLSFFIFELPLSFYSGYVIEHRFQVSNLSLAGWFKESLKRSVLSFAFSLLLIEGLFFLIHQQPSNWWIWAWGAYAAVSWVLGKLFPVFIIPLFYKCEPIKEGELKTRISALLNRFNLPTANLFSINLSKTTKKANAAFMGLGKTKRVVLSDTLLENFSPKEIEQVVAHELGHYTHKDIWKQLGLGLMISLACFYLGFLGVNLLVESLGISSAANVATLPLLMLIFLGVSYASMPLTNGFSRICEFAADKFALDACQSRDTFISMMQKLGELNLADPNPEPWYEFLFYDHPSIKKRIQAAKNWNLK